MTDETFSEALDGNPFEVVRAVLIFCGVWVVASIVLAIVVTWVLEFGVDTGTASTIGTGLFFLLQAILVVGILFIVVARIRDPEPVRWRRWVVGVAPFALLGAGIWGALVVTHPLGRALLLMFDALLVLTLFRGWETVGDALDTVTKYTGIDMLAEHSDGPGPDYLTSTYTCGNCGHINDFYVQDPLYIDRLTCSACSYTLDEQAEASQIAHWNHEEWDEEEDGWSL